MTRGQGRWPEEIKTTLAKIRGSLSIERAAVVMNITGRALSRYENGDTDVPMKIADKMATLYHFSMDVLYKALRDT